MAMTFVVGTAADVYGADLARLIDAALGVTRGTDAYRSEPVNAMGWRELQTRVMRTLDVAPQLTGVDAYQAVYVPSRASGVEPLPVGNLADPLQVGSLEALLAELHAFGAAASLPTDDVELMGLAAQQMENEDPDADLDEQTYVQLLLTAKQALARRQALWVVV